MREPIVGAIGGQALGGSVAEHECGPGLLVGRSEASTEARMETGLGVT